MIRIIEIVIAIVVFFIAFLIIRSLLSGVFPYLPPPVENPVPTTGSMY